MKSRLIFRSHIVMHPNSCLRIFLHQAEGGKCNVISIIINRIIKHTVSKQPPAFPFICPLWKKQSAKTFYWVCLCVKIVSDFFQDARYNPTLSKQYPRLWIYFHNLFLLPSVYRRFYKNCYVIGFIIHLIQQINQRRTDSVCLNGSSGNE